MVSCLEMKTATFFATFSLENIYREVEHRLAEIEMQICGASSGGSVSSQENEPEDTERNRESII